MSVFPTVFQADVAGLRADGGQDVVQKFFRRLSRRIGLMQVARGPVQQGQVAVLLFKVVGLFGNLSFQIIV